MVWRCMVTLLGDFVVVVWWWFLGGWDLELLVGLMQYSFCLRIGCLAIFLVWGCSRLCGFCGLRVCAVFRVCWCRFVRYLVRVVCSGYGFVVVIVGGLVSSILLGLV